MKGGDMNSSRRLACSAATVVLATLGLVASSVGVGAASAAGAEVFHLNTTETQTFADVNPCNGEAIDVTGTLRSSLTITQTPSGNSVEESLGAFQGTAVGDTGAQYVVETVGSDHGGVFTAGPDRQVSILLNPTFHYVRTGEDGTPDDWFAHVVLITHIDLETLTVTHEVVHSSAECR
jgi:hypothetical protein